ncbi:hypothetical protein ACN9VK_08645 [Staphylococcus caprae]
MDELVKMTFSDGNGNVLREGYVAVTMDAIEDKINDLERGSDVTDIQS